MWLRRLTGSTMKIVFAAIKESSRPQTHWDATYYPIIPEIKQKSIPRLKHEKYIIKKILSRSLKSQSCKVLRTVAADTTRHVHHLCNIKHVSISIDVVIYVAGTTHMLKISICSSALWIWNQNTHHFPGSSPIILQKHNECSKFCAPLVYNIAQRSTKLKAFRCYNKNNSSISIKSVTAEKLNSWVWFSSDFCFFHYMYF